jgi:hypothetical protein
LASLEGRATDNLRELMEEAAAIDGLTVEFGTPPRHRAEVDARRLALTYLGRSCVFAT